MVKIASQVAKPMALIAAGLVTALVVVPTCQVATAADGYQSESSSTVEGGALVVAGGLATVALFESGASAAAASGTVGATEAGAQMQAYAHQMTQLQTQLANTTDPAQKAAIQTQIDALQAQMDTLARANPSFIGQ